MEFQQQLYTLRKQGGLSQEELAHIVGVSRQAVQKWEAGAARPDLDNLIALAQYFRVSLDELVGSGAEAPEPERKSRDGRGGYYALDGAAVYYIPCRWHYEYKSKHTFLGLPLVHIHFADRGLARATGVFAMGNLAIGLVSVGGLSAGLLSLGGLSLGLLAGVGGLAIGGLVLGGLAVGVVAIGGCAVGSIALGGLAIGNAALGGCAIGDVAMGSAAIGQTAFALGDNNMPSPQIWAAFCQAIRAKGLGYQTLAALLSRLGPI